MNHDAVLAAQRLLQDATARYGEAALARVTASLLDYLTGARDDRGLLRRGLQAVKMAYLPQLTARPWHEPDRHAEIERAVDVLRSAFEPLREEVVAALGAEHTLGYYDHSDLTAEENERWRAIFLIKAGVRDPRALARFPAIGRFIEALGEALCPNGDVFLSILEPGLHIPPHHDFVNYTLTLHFGVIVPPSCRFRVGGETRTWTENQALLFDQSFEHEVWNPSERARVCLVADVWHPEVTAPERAVIDQVTRLFVA